MPNVYVSKFFDPAEKKTKHIKAEGHTYSVDFEVKDAWYGEVRLTHIPASSPHDALCKAGKMLERVLPGSECVGASYHIVK